MEKARFGRKVKFNQPSNVGHNHTELSDSMDSSTLDEKKNDLSKSISKTEPESTTARKLRKGISSSSRLSRISSSFRNDLIRDHYVDNKKGFTGMLRFFGKHLILPNIVSLILAVCFLSAMNYLHVRSCYLPPNCVCDDLKLQMISTLKELFATYFIWFILLFMTLQYARSYRIFWFVFSLFFVFGYYLISNEKSFLRYPVYFYFLFVNFLGAFLYSSKKSIKERLVNVFKMNGFYIAMIINYLFLIVAKDFKKFIGNMNFEIFYNFYVLIFFSSMQQTLIIYGRKLCENNEILISNDKFLFALNCRISLSFLLSFLSAPFMDFSIDNYYKYGLIFSYSNSVIALYTRINIIEIIWKRLFNFIFHKLKISFRFSQKIDETEIYLSKKISGSCHDVLFVAMTSVFIFYFWQKTVSYADCEHFVVETFNYFGIIISSSINFVATYSLIYLIKRTKITFFSYPIWKNIYLNILILFLIRCLFEENVLMIIKRLV